MIPSKENNDVNLNFQKLLDKFHFLTKNSPESSSIKKQLNELIQEATTTLITGHQRDAIISRCHNYLNGTYESTSKEYSVHQHTKS